ncbi:hypothetical protein TAO_0770 [Candidatus Nitrosoglobus terrae]|uniref:Uncharacterized protein n=1 Tax=Candidatus Nitrosoglobus terrae TaxID=1630141 RepID=A0A1Q2SLZ4_9GAMM|nr:polymer-forming cytoskeletal protein [Candidatus Nitrosoglobus terrae]BAW80140.1 hypothetical protein TAO_0770 [Candidatus Nitrosoglobus terrae]
MKYLLTAITLLVISNTSLAISIDLGTAGNYTLLATGSGGWYGDLNLGSGANIEGNVGAHNSLELGASATVSGDASYGNLSLGANASINGSSTQEGASFWDNLHSDLRSISDQAYSYTGIDKGYIGTS